LDFIDTNDDYVSVSDNASIDFADEDLTVCAWINSDDYSSADHSVVLKGNDGSGGIRYNLFFGGNGADLYMVLDDNVNKTQIGWSAHGMSTGVWYFICGRRDTSGNTVRVYENAIQRATGSDITGSISGQNNRDLLIGASGSAASYPQTGSDFDGMIAHVNIYGTALTTDQMAELRDCPGKNVAPDRRMYVPLMRTTPIDIGENSLTVTNNGADASTSGPPIGGCSPE